MDDVEFTGHSGFNGYLYINQYSNFGPLSLHLLLGAVIHVNLFMFNFFLGQLAPDVPVGDAFKKT